MKVPLLLLFLRFSCSVVGHGVQGTKEDAKVAIPFDEENYDPKSELDVVCSVTNDNFVAWIKDDTGAKIPQVANRNLVKNKTVVYVEHGSKPGEQHCHLIIPAGSPATVGGMYTCQGKIKQDKLRVVIRFNLANAKATQQLHVGERGKIVLGAISYPLSKIKWKKDGVDLDFSDPRLTLEKDGSIVFTKVLKSDAGSYDVNVNWENRKLRNFNIKVTVVGSTNSSGNASRPCIRDCFNGGSKVCRSNVRHYCICFGGYTGNRCQFQIPTLRPCIRDCFNGGSKVCQSNGRHYCICFGGYTGNRCQARFTTKNPFDRFTTRRPLTTRNPFPFTTRRPFTTRNPFRRRLTCYSCSAIGSITGCLPRFARIQSCPRNYMCMFAKGTLRRSGRTIYVAGCAPINEGCQRQCDKSLRSGRVTRCSIRCCFRDLCNSRGFTTSNSFGRFTTRRPFTTRNPLFRFTTRNPFQFPHPTTSGYYTPKWFLAPRFRRCYKCRIAPSMRQCLSRTTFCRGECMSGKATLRSDGRMIYFAGCRNQFGMIQGRCQRTCDEALKRGIASRCSKRCCYGDLCNGESIRPTARHRIILRVLWRLLGATKNIINTIQVLLKFQMQQDRVGAYKREVVSLMNGVNSHAQLLKDSRDPEVLRARQEISATRLRVQSIINKLDKFLDADSIPESNK